MDRLYDLRDLLVHELKDLQSCEEQIIEALPKMTEKAVNPMLKASLDMHLQVTKTQLERLKNIQENLVQKEEEEEGFFAGLFGSGSEKCKGTEGLIKEGEKMMDMKMSDETMDAAIIGCAQKIEHYEIAGYGTAVAYARELGLDYVAEQLEMTLQEEYDADDTLTELAISRVNVDAENSNM